jgi:uncharacterized protein
MVILTILLLSIMEISLSFDNAVINASILKDMSLKWRTRFIIWGIPIAVFGMRLIFPVMVVYAVSALSIPLIIDMAINDPIMYGKQLAMAHGDISAFGGMFLLMVFLDFLWEKKERYWIPIEKPLEHNNLLALGLLVPLFLWSLPALYGAGCFMGLRTLLDSCNESGDPTACVIKQQGFMRFLYLEIIDASCSFDGVIGAFAITNNIFMIMIGLGIGATVIRSLTLWLVRGGILAEYPYLEHGAQWAIGALGILMLLSIHQHIPELLIGLTGIGFIGASLCKK